MTKDSTVITSDYDESDLPRVIRKECKKNGILTAYKEYQYSEDGTTQIDTYNCNEGIKSEWPSGTVIKKFGRMYQEIRYDEEGNLNGLTEYENGRIKRRANVKYNTVLSGTQFLGDNDYMKAPEYNLDDIIDYSKQGKVGDCWLLSGLNSLNTTTWGRQAIKDSMTKDFETGDIIITLKGAYGKKKKFTVTQKELDDAYNNNTYSAGDRTNLAFEIAIDKYRMQYGERIDDGGWEEEISRLILGKSCIRTAYGESEVSALLKKAEKDPDKYIITPALIMNDEEEISLHQFYYKRTECDKGGSKYIVLSNPWNSQVEIRLTEDEFYSKLHDCEYISKPSWVKSQDVSEIDSDSIIQDVKMSRKSNKSVGLAVLNAYKYSSNGQQALKRIINKDAEGNVIVNLGGYDFKINKYELATAKASGYYSEGDDDVIAIEIATERLHSRHLNAKYDSSISDKVGMETMLSPFEMIRLMSNSYQFIDARDDKGFIECLDMLSRKENDFMAVASDYSGECCTIKNISKDEYGEYIIAVIRPENSSVELQYSLEDFKSIYGYINVFKDAW